MMKPKREGAAGRLSNQNFDDESMVLYWCKDGELPPLAMALQAKRVLQCAARRKWGFQEVWTTGPDGAVVEKIRLKNAPGGCVILDRQDAGTKLGAGLVLAIEGLGAGCKVRIGEVRP